jgi:hypothetical protein
MDAWKRSILVTAAYFFIPVYWKYSFSTFSDQGLGWNFFGWSQSSGWSFISFAYAFSDLQIFLFTVPIVILAIVLIAVVVLGYRSRSPQFALGLMITTFLILVVSLYGYYVGFTSGASYFAVPTDIPILITMLVFSNQSRRSVVPTPGPVSNEIMKKCLKCGYTNILTARFCLSCGAEIGPSGDGTRIY